MRTSDNKQISSTNQEQPTEKQVDFLNALITIGISNLSSSLKLIHDLALYESETTLNRKEKTALFHLKFLWESINNLN